MWNRNQSRRSRYPIGMAKNTWEKKGAAPSSVDKKPQFSSQFDDYLHHQPVKWLTGAPPTQLWLAPLTGCALACDGCSQREGDEGRLISSRENWRDLHWGYTVIYRVN